MRFKEWLSLDETRFKGLWRQFQKEHPNMPHYAQKDLYDNRVAYTMKQLLAKSNGQSTDPLAPTTAMDGSDQSGFHRNTQSDLPSNLPKKIFDAHNLRGYHWKDRSQDPIYADPSDFDKWTQDILIRRHFGFKVAERIRDDEARTKRQREKVQQTPGDHEPVIIIVSPDEPGKYKLLEGWHRSMGAFLAGAPESQYNALQQPNTNPYEYIDFEPWRKVPLPALIGYIQQGESGERPAANSSSALVA